MVVKRCMSNVYSQLFVFEGIKGVILKSSLIFVVTFFVSLATEEINKVTAEINESDMSRGIPVLCSQNIDDHTMSVLRDEISVDYLG